MYQPALWQPLFGAVASASAALTGLLFIALSLNLRAILGQPALAAMARETLGGLLGLLVLSVIMLVPGVDPRVVGSTLVALGLLGIGIGLRLQVATIRRLPPHQRLGWALRLAGLDAGTATVVVAGVGLLTHSLGGLLWLVPMVLVDLLWASLNAWNLMVLVAEE